METMIRPIRQYLRVILIARIVRESLLGLFLILLTFIAYGTLPNRWYHILYVTSGSMAPTLSPGDVIVITPPPIRLEPGMVLTINVDGQLVTHRLLWVNPDGSLLTKGDFNPVPDDWGNARVRVVGLYRFHIPLLGYLSNLTAYIHPAPTGAWLHDTGSIEFGLTTNLEEPAGGTSLSAHLCASGFHDNSTDSYGVDGEICVTNQGLVTTTDLLIAGQVETRGNGNLGYVTLPDAGITIPSPGTLAPGETRCYLFRTMFPPIEGVQYRLTITSTITNHAGWLPGGPKCAGSMLCPFGPTVRADFDLPNIFLQQEQNIIPTAPTETILPQPPIVELPTAEPQIIETQTIEPPTEAPTDAPAFEEPTTESPPTEEPTTEPPTAEPPISEPATDAPAQE
jgi:signal peptidase I